MGPWSLTIAVAIVFWQGCDSPVERAASGTNAGGAGGIGAIDSGSAGAAVDAPLVADAAGDTSESLDGAPPETTRCEPRFPYQDEPALGTWLGGDSAFSLPLSSSTSLWTFQDSFIGGHNQNTRANARLIAGTVALAECRNGTYSIHYFWNASGNPPRAIFDDRNAAGDRFWSHQPWMHEGAMYASLTIVHNDATAPLGFAETGTKLARVANPLDVPTSWRIEYLELSTLAAVGKGVALEDGFVDLYAPFEGDVIVARLPLDALAATTTPATLLQYLSSDGTWKPGIVASDAKKMGIAANTGMTLRFHPGASKWLALYTDTHQFPSPTVSLSMASKLEGPWSGALGVYSVPEMNVATPGFDADTYCYAAYEHPEWNSNAERLLAFTYTCNSRSFAKLVANLDIYLPRAVSVPIP
jgi:hypothetical protein